MLQHLLTTNTPIAVVLALLTVGLLAWQVRSKTFRSLSWQSFMIAAAVFWGSLAVMLVCYAWQFYYSQFAPPSYRLAAPIASFLVYSLVALLLRSASLRLPGSPALWFCLLGGLQSVPEHAIAIYRLGILHIPLLRDTTAEAIFVFAYFEYVVYWGLALFLTVLVDRLWKVSRTRLSNLRSQQEDPSHQHL